MLLRPFAGCAPVFLLGLTNYFIEFRLYSFCGIPFPGSRVDQKIADNASPVVKTVALIDRSKGIHRVEIRPGAEVYFFPVGFDNGCDLGDTIGYIHIMQAPLDRLRPRLDD